MRWLLLVLAFAVSACDLSVTTPILSPAAPATPRFATLLGTQLTAETAVILTTALPPTDTTTFEVEWRDASGGVGPLVATGANLGRPVSLAPGATYEVWARFRVAGTTTWDARRYVYTRNIDGSWPPAGLAFAF